MHCTFQAAEPAISSFYEVLRAELPDTRDSRGKRLDLYFIIVGVVLAMLTGSRTASSIVRYIGNSLGWLRRLTNEPDARPVSRSHLPVLLAGVDRAALNELIFRHFGARLGPDEWAAVDGKELRGCGSGENRHAVLLAVGHDSKEEIAQMPQTGPKDSETVRVRSLLAESGLARNKVTLDALHCNPETTSQVARAGGTYLVQVKDNQPDLWAICALAAVQEPALARMVETEKAHGRLTTREYELRVLRPHALHKRWGPSKVRTLVSVVRRSEPINGQTAPSVELSCYISNATIGDDRAKTLKELSGAIRHHWQVEANNWTRDVTLGEDGAKTVDGEQALAMAALRSLSLMLLRKTRRKNLAEAIDRLRQVPGALVRLLRQSKFL